MTETDRRTMHRDDWHHDVPSLDDDTRRAIERLLSSDSPPSPAPPSVLLPRVLARARAGRLLRYVALGGALLGLTLTAVVGAGNSASSTLATRRGPEPSSAFTERPEARAPAVPLAEDRAQPPTEARVVTPPSTTERTSPGPHLPSPDLRARSARQRPVAPTRPGLAPSGSLAEETALFQRARDQRRVERDPEAALATLETYRQRYPRGVFSTEAALSTLELLTELRRWDRAWSESEAFLARHGDERAAEVRLLRGELLRTVQRRYEPARREYDLALQSPHPTERVREAVAWGLAAAHDAEGHRDAALQGYRAYLRDFPSGRHHALALARLRALEPGGPP